MPTEEEIKKLIEFEKRLGEYSGDDRVISSTEFKERLEKEEKKVFLFKTGFPKLDSLIDGFETGELIVISGPTKMGKTTLAKTFTENLAKQGAKTIWFSYEMPPRQLIEKFEKDVIFYLPAILRRRDLYWIEERIWEAKLKYEIKAVAIDHLHYLFDISKIKYPSLEIGYLVRRLKQLAIKHNLIIFLICHLTKTSINGLPSIEDLRDSSLIAQESDSVLLIKRMKDETTTEFIDKAKLKIDTHRRKGVMGKIIPLLFKDNTFFELEEYEK